MSRPLEGSPPRLALVAKLRAEIAAGSYDTPARLAAVAAGMAGLQPLAMEQRSRPHLLAERDRCERRGELDRVLEIDVHLAARQ